MLIEGWRLIETAAGVVESTVKIVESGGVRINRLVVSCINAVVLLRGVSATIIKEMHDRVC